MAALDSLTAAYNNYCTILAQITANPKPSYSLDGETYSWTEYQAFILDKMLLLESAIQRAGGPFELRTSAVT